MEITTKMNDDFNVMELLLTISNGVASLQASFNAFEKQTKEDFTDLTIENTKTVKLIEDKTSQFEKEQNSLRKEVFEEINLLKKTDIEIIARIDKLETRPKDWVFKIVISALGVVGVAILGWVMTTISHALNLKG